MCIRIRFWKKHIFLSQKCRMPVLGLALYLVSLPSSSWGSLPHLLVEGFSSTYHSHVHALASRKEKREKEGRTFLPLRILPSSCTNHFPIYTLSLTPNITAMAAGKSSLGPAAKRSANIWKFHDWGRREEWVLGTNLQSFHHLCFWPPDYFILPLPKGHTHSILKKDNRKVPARPCLQLKVQDLWVRTSFSVRSRRVSLWSGDV